MKTTTLVPRCTPGAAARSPSAARTRLHAPPRYPVGMRQSAGAPDEIMYFESLDEPSCDADRARKTGRPHVLHVDADATAVRVLAALLAPEACVTSVATLAEARHLLATAVFSLVVMDPALPDGDPRTLLPLLGGTPLLVYSALQPEWRDASPAWLPKPWTSARQLWVTIAGMLGLPASLTAGD